MFNIGDIVQYETSGNGYYNSSRSAYVMITDVLGTCYVLGDLDTCGKRTISHKTLDNKGCRIDKEDLDSNKRFRADELYSKLKIYTTSTQDKPMIKTNTPTLNLVSVHNIDPGQCVQTNTAYYLSLQDGLLDLTTMKVIPRDESNNEVGILRTIKISIEA
jgi:hypothetical protein